MFHRFSDEPYAIFGRMVRILLSAVLFSLVVTVSARAAILHNQYYFADPIPPIAGLAEELEQGEFGTYLFSDPALVGAEFVTEPALVGVGSFDLSPSFDFSPSGVLDGTCGFVNDGVDCANYFIFAMENFFFLNGDGGYDPANSIQEVRAATWTVYGDWSLSLNLQFVDPITGVLNTLLLAPAAAMLPNSIGTCSDTDNYFGLCNTGIGGAFVTELAVLSMPMHDVPEPSTLSLFATGLAGLGFMGWKRRSGCS